MAISEEKMRIVIDNYFKTECDVNTSIRQAFEKGFRIGVKKGLSVQPKPKTGKWIERNPQNSDKCRLIKCDQCGFAHIVGFNVPYEHWIENRNFCERCGADMRKKGEK